MRVITWELPRTGKQFVLSTVLIIPIVYCRVKYYIIVIPYDVAVAGRWSLVAGRWSLVAGRWSLVAGHWSLVTGHWSLVTGHWSLVTGHWSLVAGRWSLVAGRCFSGNFPTTAPPVYGVPPFPESLCAIPLSLIHTNIFSFYRFHPTYYYFINPTRRIATICKPL